MENIIWAYILLGLLTAGWIVMRFNDGRSPWLEIFRSQLDGYSNLVQAVGMRRGWGAMLFMCTVIIWWPVEIVILTAKYLHHRRLARPPKDG